MRIFGKIFKILLNLVFICSIALNVIFVMSSTTISIFTDKEKAMREIYYSASTALSDSEEIAITSTMPYASLKDHTSTDKIVCKKSVAGSKIPYNCEMISKLYDEKSTLVKTSYFPGDGYKYTDEGTTQTKTAFSNETLYSYFLGLVYGASSSISYLAANSDTVETYKMSFDSEFKFNIDTFSLDKNITVKYTGLDKVEQTIDLHFDAHDRLQYINDHNNKSNLSISYSNNELEFPILVGYSNN